MEPDDAPRRKRIPVWVWLLVVVGCATAGFVIGDALAPDDLSGMLGAPFGCLVGLAVGSCVTFVATRAGL